MTTILPIRLAGDNLGKRHLYLNTLVNEAFERNEDFNLVKDLPEKSPVDRLFKINLATKIRDVDYIIKNLKDDDMLYVSKALKSTWLIETKYEDIINPKYLEESLFPEMITTAITKMKHWLHINLKDETRCKHFFEYYYKNNVIDLAIKFLTKCSEDVIQNEFIKVVHNVDPHNFKILSEKCSQVVKIFYDLLPNDEELKSQYLMKEKDYFLVTRHLLKTDTAMVLKINEKYFNTDKLYRFSTTQTKFIMNHHSERFWQKPELYATWLLNIQAVADSLGSEEAKKLVLLLAQAKYLTRINWFGYKFLEPILKRVNHEERGEFKRKVFVNKDVGSEVEEWPYEIPAPPIKEQTEYPSIFDDPPPDLHFKNFGLYENTMRTAGMAMNNTCNVFSLQSTAFNNNFVNPFTKVKTMLDRLFDEFRFTSFRHTLYELKKRISAESSPQNREYMILVLISKSGGRLENITLLLELLAQHKNEPPNVRAAIIRSLVKRAYVWRLPESSWKQLLYFGQGLGLDGLTPLANCFEGLHAVVIRSLLLTGKCEPAIHKAFLNNFSTLTDYSLNATEKKHIGKSLAKILISVTQEKHENIYDAITYICKVIDILNAYKMNIETYPGLIEIIANNAKRYLPEMSYVLTTLYRTKVARKQLFPFYYKIMESDASYTHALRHDLTVLDEKKIAEYYTMRRIPKVAQFLIKISIYFGEPNGLASKLLNNLKLQTSIRQNTQVSDQTFIKTPDNTPQEQLLAFQFGDQPFIKSKEDGQPHKQPSGYHFDKKSFTGIIAHSQPLGKLLEFQIASQSSNQTNDDNKLLRRPSGSQLGYQPFLEGNAKIEPNIKPIVQTIAHPIVQPLVQSIPQLIVQPTAQPIAQPLVQPVPQAIFQPTAFQFGHQPFIQSKEDSKLQYQPSGYNFGTSLMETKADCKILAKPLAFQFGEPYTQTKVESELIQPTGYHFSDQNLFEENADSQSTVQPISLPIVQPIPQVIVQPKQQTFQLSSQSFLKAKTDSIPLFQPSGFRFNGSQPFTQTTGSIQIRKPVPTPNCDSKIRRFIRKIRGNALLGRALAYLLGDQLQTFIQEVDTLSDVKSKQLAASIRANAHLTRPAIDLDAFGCKKAGAKLIANRVLKCRSVELDNNIEALLKWKKTAKLALTLSKRTKYEIEVFIKLATQRPTSALKYGLKLMITQSNEIIWQIWKTIKPIIQNLDVSKTYLVKIVANINKIPKILRPKYSTVVYCLFKDKLYVDSMDALSHVELLLPDVNEDFIENLLLQFLKENFVLERQSNEWSHFKFTSMYIRILIKYLFLSKTEDIQKHRMETLGDPFLAKMVELRNCSEKKEMFFKYFHVMITSFKYSKAFLNILYVTSLPVMEKVVVWLQNIFSIEKQFKVFVFIHLSMLYFKAVRRSVESSPEVFADEKRKNKEGVVLVGNIFGKYVAKEVHTLTVEYFDTIIELYHNSFVTYLDRTNSNYSIPSNWHSSVIIGILEGSKGSEYRLAMYLFKEKQGYLRSEDVEEIQKYVNRIKVRETQWLYDDYIV